MQYLATNEESVKCFFWPKMKMSNCRHDHAPYQHWYGPMRRASKKSKISMNDNIFMIFGSFGASGWHIPLSKVPGEIFEWTDDGYLIIWRQDPCPSLNQIIVDF